MRFSCLTMVFAVLVLVNGAVGQAQTPQPGQASGQSTPRRNPTPEEIIKQFSDKETEFYEAWVQYTYRQTAVIRVLSVDGVATKERMTLVSDIVFNDNGTREVERVQETGNLRSVKFTKEDEEVINNIQPFALTAKELPLYELKYEGREKVDELECYLFSVKPKSIKKDKMYFEGQIWVDDQDLQIVRTMGKPVPQKKENQFPEFETIRQMVDDKYWFPVWTHADSRLSFPDQVVRIEETITYEDYKKFVSKATIKYEDTKQ